MTEKEIMLVVLVGIAVMMSATAFVLVITG